MDVKRGKRLVESRITRGKKSIHYCALACNKHPSCLSFNFCGRRTCELNKEDIFSTTNGNQNLKDDASCRYVGMAKLDHPMCKERGEDKDIQDDIHEGTCAINGKRVDAEWGEWKVDKTPSVDTNTVWKQFEKRGFLLDPAHGGRTDGESQRVYSWIQWVKQSKTWTHAKNNCVRLGGKLFYNLDGTKKQLDFFFDKMDQKPHWLGIYTKNHKSWLTVEGSVIAKSRLHWDPKQGFNAGKKGQKHVANYAGGSYRYLNDRHYSDQYLSVCDLTK